MPTMTELRRASTEALIAREQAKIDALIAALPWWKRIMVRAIRLVRR
jgi:hypothetical protein